MKHRPRWTTPSEIRARLQRRWERGDFLTYQLTGEATPFPLQLKLRTPDARSLRDDFDAVRAWIRELEQGSRTVLGHGYDIEWTEINHRLLGKNRLPEAVVVAERKQALALLRVDKPARRFEQLTQDILRDFPELTPWLARKPFVALEHEADWPRIVRVLGWLRANPRPGVYLRQLEIPGVDSKFMESNKVLLAELLDCVLPAHAIQSHAHPTRQFELRYGLKPKPALLRFRYLDPTQALGPLDDISTPAAQFAQLQLRELPIDNVFVTENEINGLAFPACARSIVVFGLGYGLQRLSEVPWLREARIFYWGDIDTHGFAMLDRLRDYLPQVRSFLMDRQTLELHRALWSVEASPYSGELQRLTRDEAALYDDLRAQRLGAGVRLEQERIAFAWVRQAITALEVG